MIEMKIKIPQNLLQYSYNWEYDILDIFIEKGRPTFSEEIYYGLYILYDRVSNDVIGVSIMDYTKRDTQYIMQFLPFDIDFNIVNNKFGL